MGILVDRIVEASKYSVIDLQFITSSANFSICVLADLASIWGGLGSMQTRRIHVNIRRSLMVIDVDTYLPSCSRTRRLHDDLHG